MMNVAPPLQRLANLELRAASKNLALQQVSLYDGNAVVLARFPIVDDATRNEGWRAMIVGAISEFRPSAYTTLTTVDASIQGSGIAQQRLRAKYLRVISEGGPCGYFLAPLLINPTTGEERLRLDYLSIQYFDWKDQPDDPIARLFEETTGSRNPQ